MEHILYWLWLANLLGANSGKLTSLIKKFGSVKALYEADFPSPLSDKSLDAAKRIYEKCINSGIGILTPDDKEYPQMLLNIHTPPVVLYTMGEAPDWNDNLFVGVVGTRKATEYGIRATSTICEDLSESGAVIVSGFAKGIDAAALRAAIKIGGQRVSVLGTGIDVDYPSGHTELFHKVLENGFIMTEYPPGTQPSKWTFPQRNRIIAGLSHGVLIVEAPKNSGALITAKYAVEENRDVFAVPGNIDTKNAFGVNNIIKQGAKAVSSAEDILEEYPYFEFVSQEREEEHTLPELPAAERDILSYLENTDVHIDELLRLSGMFPNVLNNTLLILEMNGYITRISGNLIHRIK